MKSKSTLRGIASDQVDGLVFARGPGILSFCVVSFSVVICSVVTTSVVEISSISHNFDCSLKTKPSKHNRHCSVA